MTTDVPKKSPTISYKYQILIVVTVALILTVGVWLSFNKKIEQLDNTDNIEYINVKP